jgi:hypothetical protein
MLAACSSFGRDRQQSTICIHANGVGPRSASVEVSAPSPQPRSSTPRSQRPQ